MAANQGAANTSKKPNVSNSGPQVGLSVNHSSTKIGLIPRWGITDPGTLASANRNSRIKAVFMLVSWRHIQRKKPTRDMGGSGTCSVVVSVAITTPFQIQAW